jgi:hypothetical protein
MSPLRQRMIEGMTIRKLAPKTQRDYVQRVKNFAAFLGRPIQRALKTYAAISFIWRQVAPAFRPLTKASQHCGEFIRRFLIHVLPSCRRRHFGGKFVLGRRGLQFLQRQFNRRSESVRRADVCGESLKGKSRGRVCVPASLLRAATFETPHAHHVGNAVRVVQAQRHVHSATGSGLHAKVIPLLLQVAPRRLFERGARP